MWLSTATRGASASTSWPPLARSCAARGAGTPGSWTTDSCVSSTARRSATSLRRRPRPAGQSTKRLRRGTGASGCGAGPRQPISTKSPTAAQTATTKPRRRWLALGRARGRLAFDGRGGFAAEQVAAGARSGGEPTGASGSVPIRTTQRTGRAPPLTRPLRLGVRQPTATSTAWRVAASTTPPAWRRASALPGGASAAAAPQSRLPP